MKEWVLRFADYLTGQSQTAAGEGVESTLAHQWPWAPWITVLLLVFATAVVVVAYSRELIELAWLRRGLIGLRMAAIAVIVLMMYGWVRDEHRTDLADLAVIVDASESMSIVDNWGNSESEVRLQQWLSNCELSPASRLNVAKSILLTNKRELISRLSQRYHLRLFSVGAATESIVVDGREPSEAINELIADQPVSRLGTGLLEVLELQRGRPTAAVVMFTDGVTTEGKTIGDAAEYARRRQIPLFMVATGNDASARDTRLSDLLVPDAAFVNDLLNFDFKVTASGYDGKFALARLFKDGDATPLAEERVELPRKGESNSGRLSYRPKEQGQFRFTVEIVPQEDEISVENNREHRTVRVSEETLRVLFVQGYPNYEFRTLKTLLARELKASQSSEHAIQLHTVLQEADPEYVQSDTSALRAFPSTREALFEYDVLIFGDCDPVLMPQSTLANIVEFVRVRGGGVVFIAGPRNMPVAFRDGPLAELLPVRMDSLSVPHSTADILESFVPVPTILGLSSPLIQLADNRLENPEIWKSLPALYWMIEAPDLKPGAMVLLEHPTKLGAKQTRLPVVCMQYVGSGNVIVHLTDETWRWSRDERGSMYYDRYWEQLIRFLGRARLGGSDRIELATDRHGEYSLGEPVRFRTRFLDERKAPPDDHGVSLVVQHENGARRTIILSRDAIARGQFEGTISNLEQGEYRAWLAVPTVSGPPPAVSFQVKPAQGEQSRLETDFRDLKLAAGRTSGQVFTIENVDQLANELPDGQQVRIEALPARKLWNLWPFPLAFVVIITTEWIVRKRLGLI